jgi:hypothetical protein
MNIDTLITGLVFLLIGLVGFLVDKPLTAKQIKNRTWGLSETQMKIGKWGTLICGIFLVVYGLINE